MLMVYRKVTPFFFFLIFIFYVRISNKCYSEMYGKHEYLNFKWQIFLNDLMLSLNKG